MKHPLHKGIQFFSWHFYKWYLRKKRYYTYDGLKVTVLPSVFHPGLLWSTKYLLKFISRFDFKNQKVLELGAGSGLISLWVSRAGARMTATDINPAAIASIKESQTINQLAISTYQSDLFDAIPPQIFDYILINPPFYPQKAKNTREFAFFCGPNFEYFQRLFVQLKKYSNAQTSIFFVFADNCDLKSIQNVAIAAGWQLQQIDATQNWRERLFIFQLKRRVRT
jgi:release factor glutamine methyltransferase